jgi:hypothetical protein
VRKSKFIILAVMMLFITLTIPFTFAKNDNNNGKGLVKGHTERKAIINGLNNKNSLVKHLYLFEQDMEAEGDPIVVSGTWGKLTVITHKNRFILNGHGLEPGLEYTLINYAPDTDWSDSDAWAWPGYGSIEIGVGETNNGGNIHLMGDWSEEIVGKIWLVLSSDFDNIDNIDPTKMLDWNPSEYLFGYELL